MDIPAGEQGFTTLVFQDKSKGMYFRDLKNLNYVLEEGWIKLYPGIWHQNC